MSLCTELHLLILSFLRKAWLLMTSFWEMTGPETRLYLRLTCRHFYHLIALPTLQDLRCIDIPHRRDAAKGSQLRLCSKCSRSERLCGRQAAHLGIIGAPLCQECDDIRVKMTCTAVSAVHHSRNHSHNHSHNPWANRVRPILLTTIELTLLN